jgi:hypothetical protein
MSVGPKWTFLGVLTNGVRVNVSRFGTHRPNEWDGRCGSLFVIHAARDKVVSKSDDRKIDLNI